jgi:hypothetical protein
MDGEKEILPSGRRHPLLGKPHRIDGAAGETKLQWATEDESTGGDQVLSWLALSGLLGSDRAQPADPRLRDPVSEAEVLPVRPLARHPI